MVSFASFIGAWPVRLHYPYYYGGQKSQINGNHLRLKYRLHVRKTKKNSALDKATENRFRQIDPFMRICLHVLWNKSSTSLIWAWWLFTEASSVIICGYFWHCVCVCVCVSAFQRFLGKKDVSQELEEVHAEARAQDNLHIASVLQLLKSPAVRWQLITIIITMACYQLCGLNAVRCSSYFAFLRLSVEPCSLCYITVHYICIHY